MSDDAKCRAFWKVRLTEWVDQLSAPITRPVRKLIVEVTHGILASGSLEQSQIARALQEPHHLHHTQKRLSRMLGRHSEVAWAAEQLQLERLAGQVSDDMVIGVDPGDRSENTELIDVMGRVRRQLSAQPLWVIDRGGDRGKLWAHWLAEDYAVCVRAANRRHWLWRDGRHTAQQIAKAVPMRHTGRMRQHHTRRVRFGVTTVYLPDYPETPLTMVVVRHGRQEPLVLVSTRRARGQRQGERLIQAYLDRWACEEGYRFTKQGFELEAVQVRRFAVLQNLVALASLAWGLLAAYSDQAEHLREHARRQKPQQRPDFPFYTLFAGFQRLFAGARHTFYHWWRRRRSSLPIPDLFADADSLLRPGITA